MLRTIRTLHPDFSQPVSHCCSLRPFAATSGRQAPNEAIRIDADDMGGVVTGPKGRSRRLGHRGDDEPAHEACENRRHRRSGPIRVARFAQSELRRVGTRVRPRGFAENEGAARKGREPDGSRCTQSARRGGVLSGRLLVVPARRACQERFSRYRSEWQWHCPHHSESGRMGSDDQVRRMHGMPSTWHQGNPRDSEGARHVSDIGCRVGAPASVWPGGEPNDLGAEQPRSRSGAVVVCRLDRSDRRRRSAAGSAAAAGNRTQRRHHSVGLGGSQGVLHDEVSTIVVTEGQREWMIYGALELSADYCPSSIGENSIGR